MNIVLDTNVLLSGVLWKGSPHQVLRFVLEKHALPQSRETLAEFKNVLSRSKFKRILQARYLTEDTIVETLIKTSTLYEVSEDVKELSRSVKIKDVNDLIFIELALSSHSRLIVSGDQHLLSLKNLFGIDILTVQDFLKVKERQTKGYR